MRKSKLRIILISLGLLVTLTGCQEEVIESAEIIRPIKAIKIARQESHARYQVPGIAKATQEAELSFRVSGTLEKMPGEIGQEVAKGEALAALDKRDFEVNVDRATANVGISEANLKNAKIEYERVKKIQSTSDGVVSQSLVDQRLAAYDSAKASYASSKAELNASLDKLSYATLKSPFKGVLVHRYVENYQDVVANNPIYRFVDLSKIEMDISLPENQISNLPTVDRFVVNFEAYPNIRIPAVIKEISNEASQMTRTYKVRLTMIPPSDIKILPGMSGYVNFEFDHVNDEETFIVPLSALITSVDGKNSYVWKYNEEASIVKKISVEKGKLSDAGVAVKGLKSGDWIASAGSNYLIDGQKVRLLPNKGE